MHINALYLLTIPTQQIVHLSQHKSQTVKLIAKNANKIFRAKPINYARSWTSVDVDSPWGHATDHTKCPYIPTHTQPITGQHVCTQSVRQKFLLFSSRVFTSYMSSATSSTE